MTKIISKKLGVLELTAKQSVTQQQQHSSRMLHFNKDNNKDDACTIPIYPSFIRSRTKTGKKG